MKISGDLHSIMPACRLGLHYQVCLGFSELNKQENEVGYYFNYCVRTFEQVLNFVAPLFNWSYINV